MVGPWPDSETRIVEMKKRHNGELLFCLGYGFVAGLLIGLFGGLYAWTH